MEGTGRKKNIFAAAMITLVLFAIPGLGQRSSTRLVFCNEKDNVADTKNLPRQGYRQDGEMWGRWQYALSDAKGSYSLRVFSRQGFNPYLYRANRDGDWVSIKVYSKWKSAKDSSGRPYYFWDLLTINQGRNQPEQTQLLLLVQPVNFRQQAITASWKTQKCKNGTARRPPVRRSRCGWNWVAGGLYGTAGAYVCKCSGRAVPTKDAVRICGRRP